MLVITAVYDDRVFPTDAVHKLLLEHLGFAVQT